MLTRDTVISKPWGDGQGGNMDIKYGTALTYHQGFVVHTQWDSAGLSETDNREQSSTTELASGNVHHITTIQSGEKLQKQAGMARYASWCSPCRAIAPAYCELADKHSSILFLTVDVDELPEFSTSWDIKATPTFFLLKDGRQIDKLVGANKQDLQKKITAIVDSLIKTK
ncbi:hypothetical protein TEA_013547 [Camellia sinensis var. sinensis]|uniref:Thioredoxin domain-containing protein n=1 Tax=Camellia sinensis var. sinensis TaxID=542762 RepID=A0A4S4EKV4_CAMSN|nr:hypothetical protein TEA_013547 [Camellia sinensis var. sinensis]